VPAKPAHHTPHSSAAGLPEQLHNRFYVRKFYVNYACLIN
jgi:hypothetical protein